MTRDSEPPKEKLKCWAMLHQYGQLVKRLNFQEERMEELRASMYETSAVKYDDMPRGSSNGSSRQERLFIRLEEMQEKLDKLANEEAEAYDRIASLLTVPKALRCWRAQNVRRFPQNFLPHFALHEPANKLRCEAK